MDEEKPEVKKSFELFTEEELATYMSRKPPSFTEYTDYLVPKTIGLATIGSSIGAATGYYLGERLAINFYGFGFLAASLGTTFMLVSLHVQDFVIRRIIKTMLVLELYMDWF